jgi:hypothetical protein
VWDASNGPTNRLTTYLDATISSRGTSTFAVATDSVIVDVSAAGTTGGLLSRAADTAWGAAHQTTRALTGTQTVTIPTVTTVGSLSAGAISDDDITGATYDLINAEVWTYATRTITDTANQTASAAAKVWGTAIAGKNVTAYTIPDSVKGKCRFCGM